MGPEMMGQWGMGWFGMIFMVAFWGLVLVGLVFLVKWLIQATRSGSEAAHGGSRALDILKERYARGEIDKSEFDAKKRDLTA
jgi:putative membrane protein